MGDNQYRDNNKRFDIETLGTAAFFASQKQTCVGYFERIKYFDLLKMSYNFGNIIKRMSKNVANSVTLCKHDILR
jgi:hypothetical protein